MKEVCLGNKAQVAPSRAYNLVLCQNYSSITSVVPLQPYVIDCGPN